MNKVEYTLQDLDESHPRRTLRDMDKQTFIDKYGSGTLRKSQKLGFDITDAYLNERVKFEFGNGFQICYSSRFSYNDIKLIPCEAMTELGWHAERMIEIRPFESDIFKCKEIDVDFEGGERIQGIGIVLMETSAQWIPNGYSVFSIVSTFNKETKQYMKAINPF